MKSKWVAVLIFSLFQNVGYAENLPINKTCQSLEGYWQGFFYLKNEEDCAKGQKSCGGQFSADVKALNGILEIKLKPAIEQRDILHAVCENNKLIISELPKLNVTFSCTPKCSVLHESEYMKASLIKIW